MRTRSALNSALIRAALLVILCAPYASAQQTDATGKPPAAPAQPVPLPIMDITRWTVSYGDAALGQIDGTAYVNWTHERETYVGGAGDNRERTGKARIVLRDPVTGGERMLTAGEIKVSDHSDDIVSAVVEGTAPGAPKVSAPNDTAVAKLVADDGDSLTVTGGLTKQQIPVKAKAMASARRISLDLRRDKSVGVLQGTWSHYADPVTQRDGDGQGRVGTYYLLNDQETDDLDKNDTISGGFLGVQEGWEQWWPLPTQIAAVTVVEDQLAQRNGFPVYLAPYAEAANPFVPPSADGVRYRWNTEEDRHRTLLIVGRNLPIDQGKRLAPFVLDSGDGIEDADVLATSQDTNLPEDTRKLFELGWQNLLAPLANLGIPVSREDASRGMEEVLVKVRLGGDVKPGPKTISWGGAHDSWLLQFGNNTVDVRLVRFLRSRSSAADVETEVAEQFYLPEEVAVEVTTRAALPFASIPVRVGVEGGKEAVFRAQKVPGNDFLYRTDPFVVGGSKSEWIDADPGDRLLATIEQRDLLDSDRFQFVAVPVAKAQLSPAPGSVKADDIGGLWQDALLRAARAQNLPTGDRNKLPAMPSGTVAGIEIKVRDHAAMLLLRQSFVEIMNQQLSWLVRLKTDEDFQQLHDWLKPYVLQDGGAFYSAPQSPNGYVKYPSWLSFIPDADKDTALKGIDDLDNQLALVGQLFKGLPGLILRSSGVISGIQAQSAFQQIEVTGFDDKPTTLLNVFVSEEQLRRSANPDDFRKWQVKVGKEVVAKYKPVVEASIKHAQGIGDSDLKALAKFTGVAFGPIVKRLLPQLMTRQSTAFPWEPDRPARAAVLNLHTTAAAIQASEDYSSIEDQYVILALTGVLAVPAMVSEGAIGSIISLSGNVLIWGSNSVQAILETRKGQRDVEFEFGNALVLGPERLRDAELRKSEWYETLASIVAQGAVVALQAQFDTLPKLAREMSIVRGQGLLRRIQDAPSKVLHSLPPAQMQDFLAYVSNALVRDSEAGIMSGAEAKAIALARSVANESGAASTALSPVKSPASAMTVDAAALKTAIAEDFHAPPATPAVEPIPNTADVAEFIPPREFPQVDKPAAQSIVALEEGNQETHFWLGKKLGEGSSAQVYEVLEVEGRQPLPEKSVIKFIGDKDAFGVGPEGQIARMRRANDLLRRTRNGSFPVEFAEISEFHDEGRYILQKKLEGPDIVFINPEELARAVYSFDGRGVGLPKSYDEISAILTKPMQRALVRLYHALGENNLIAMDLPLTNIYFRDLGNGEYVCGILDVDLIVDANEYAATKDNWAWKRLGRIIEDPVGGEIGNYGIYSLPKDGRFLGDVTTGKFDARAIMEKMLEFRGHGGNLRIPFVAFDESVGAFAMDPKEPFNLIHPDIVKEVYPNFATPPKPAAPAAAPPASAPPPPPKKSENVIPLRFGALRFGIAADNENSPLRKAA